MNGKGKMDFESGRESEDLGLTGVSKKKKKEGEAVMASMEAGFMGEREERKKAWLPVVPSCLYKKKKRK